MAICRPYRRRRRQYYGVGEGRRTRESGRSLERIERPVNLDRIERVTGELELQAVGELFRVENSAPPGVGPTGDADVQVARQPASSPGNQMIRRESCHKMPCFSQSFRNV